MEGCGYYDDAEVVHDDRGALLAYVDALRAALAEMLLTPEQAPDPFGRFERAAAVLAEGEPAAVEPGGAP